MIMLGKHFCHNHINYVSHGLLIYSMSRATTWSMKTMTLWVFLCLMFWISMWDWAYWTFLSFFLFWFQGAQTVGMGVEAQNVNAAAELFKKANDILGYEILTLVSLIQSLGIKKEKTQSPWCPSMLIIGNIDLLNLILLFPLPQLWSLGCLCQWAKRKAWFNSNKPGTIMQNGCI